MIDIDKHFKTKKFSTGYNIVVVVIKGESLITCLKKVNERYEDRDKIGTN